VLISYGSTSLKGDMPRRPSKNDVNDTLDGKRWEVLMRIETFDWLRLNIVLDILSVMEELIQTCIIHSRIRMTCTVSQLVSLEEMNNVPQRT
jgi:hypothetical protein